jgi:HEAT repeat protein
VAHLEFLQPSPAALLVAFMTRIVIVALALLTSASLAQQSPDPAEHAWQVITDGFKDSNPDKRKEVVDAASLAITNQRTYGLLGDALHDSDAQVRVAACETLCSWRDKRSIPPLRSALKDEVPEVVFCAAQGLWQLGDPQGRTVLLSVVEGNTKASSGYIVKQKRDALRMLKTPGTLITTLAKFGVGFAPVPGLGTGFSSLRGLMKNSEVTPRAMALLDISQDRRPDTLKVLREALNDKDWSMRAAAVHALALRNQTDALDDLIPLLDDKKGAVSCRAAFTYLRLSNDGKKKPNVTPPELASKTSSANSR